MAIQHGKRTVGQKDCGLRTREVHQPLYLQLTIPDCQSTYTWSRSKFIKAFKGLKIVNHIPEVSH